MTAIALCMYAYSSHWVQTRNRIIPSVANATMLLNRVRAQAKAPLDFRLLIGQLVHHRRDDDSFGWAMVTDVVQADANSYSPGDHLVLTLPGVGSLKRIDLNDDIDECIKPHPRRQELTYKLLHDMIWESGYPVIEVPDYAFPNGYQQPAAKRQRMDGGFAQTCA